MNVTQSILNKILIIPAVLLGLTAHEYAHAYVADKLGDKTPKFQGRLTFNPFNHIDIVGFIMILFIGFGWAKPVETNPRAFKNGHKDEIKVSVAGTVANLIIAFIFAIITAVFYKFQFIELTSIGYLQNIIRSILTSIVSINCMLAVFNLIPIPGLDGFNILRCISPRIFYKVSNIMYTYQLIILVIFIVTPIASILVGIPSSFLYSMFMRLAFSII